MGHVVHEEGLEFALEPKDGLFGAHVDIEGAEDAFFLDIDVLDNI